MARINKMTMGVFTDVVGKFRNYPKFETFVKLRTKETSTNDLKRQLASYKRLVEKGRKEFEYLAVLEEVIMQNASLQAPLEMVFFRARQYVYVRCAFYRSDVVTSDVRVIVANVDKWKMPYTKLIKNQEFLALAEEKVREKMREVLANTELKLAELTAKREKANAEQVDKPSPKKSSAKKPTVKKPAAKKPAAKKSTTKKPDLVKAELAKPKPKPKVAVIQEDQEIESETK
jgi:hypothetical protein